MGACDQSRVGADDMSGPWGNPYDNYEKETLTNNSSIHPDPQSKYPTPLHRQTFVLVLQG